MRYDYLYMIVIADIAIKQYMAFKIAHKLFNERFIIQPSHYLKNVQKFCFTFKKL